MKHYWIKLEAKMPWEAEDYETDEEVIQSVLNALDDGIINWGIVNPKIEIVEE
jgi:hypothetical protein